MFNRVVFSSDSFLWNTPKYVFDCLDEEFHFTLDPCCTHENALCTKHFTSDEDGLVQPWRNEIVFCNPPYSRKLGDWVKKSFCEVYYGDCKCVVLLIPARTDTKWFHDYILRYFEVRFIRGRLRFSECKNNAPFPSMICIIRSEDFKL